MTSQLRVFLFGFRKTLPFQSGVVPFGLLYATLAGTVGFSWWVTMLLSVVVFGGSSQLVFVDLMQTLFSPLQATLGANIVNARHLIYSAGVSRRYAGFSRGWQLFLCYLLTDQLFAVSESEKEQVDRMPQELVPWFYFGSGFCTWIFWVIATAVGIVFGHIIPTSWNLGFSIPLLFMPLVFSVAKTRAAAVSCVLAVLFVFLLQKLPFGLGVLAAILIASALGYLLRNRVGGRK
ncbi:MAG TPA: AzlC family ABC transporter permease [Pseudobdellovibrionaceae bacterium]|nr:AzlC family ABC transporter permease [Pseudobdellovibrionaceae bacterium]